MGYNVSGSGSGPDTGTAHVLQITSAKAKATKNGHIRLPLSIAIVEGASAGFTFFHDLWLVNKVKNSAGELVVQEAKTAQWMRQAGEKIVQILGYEPDDFELPEKAGEETAATKLLVGAVFQSMIRLQKGDGEYPDSYKLGKILGPVELGGEGYDEDADPDDSAIDDEEIY